MSVKPYLERAGKFGIIQIPCPHFNQDVVLESPRAGVLHSTEGGWDGSLNVFKSHFAPHFLVGPGRIAQLVQIGTIGAALVTHNWLAIVQIEVVGFTKLTPWSFDDATTEALAALMAVCKAEYGIPLTRPWPDGVYGMARSNDPHRNQGQFGTIAGWYAHGDVPAPDSHYDVGNFEWSKLFAAAAALPEANANPSPAPVAPPRPCAGGPPDLSTMKGLQAALCALGYKISVDGVYGDQTRAAIKAFQAHAGLVQDGIAGVATDAAVLKALAALA